MTGAPPETFRPVSVPVPPLAILAPAVGYDVRRPARFFALFWERGAAMFDDGHYSGRADRVGMLAYLRHHATGRIANRLGDRCLVIDNEKGQAFTADRWQTRHFLADQWDAAVEACDPAQLEAEITALFGPFRPPSPEEINRIYRLREKRIGMLAAWLDGQAQLQQTYGECHARL